MSNVQKGTQTWKRSSPKKSYSAHSKLKFSFYAYTSFSNTKVLSFKCDAYIMYSNEILPWGGLFFHWFFPFFFNIWRHMENIQTPRPHPEWSRCFRLHSWQVKQVAQPINGKNCCFFGKFLPKGIYNDFFEKEMDDFLLLRRFFFGIGNSTSTISYEFQTSKVLFLVFLWQCETVKHNHHRSAILGAPVWSMFRNPKIGPTFERRDPNFQVPSTLGILDPYLYLSIRVSFHDQS